jgi:hypothetical protein
MSEKKKLIIHGTKVDCDPLFAANEKLTRPR